MPERLRGLAPNLLVQGGKEFPTIGKTYMGQPDGPSDGVLDLVRTLLSCMYFLRRLQFRTKLLLFFPSLFISCVSLSFSLNFQPPLLLLWPLFIDFPQWSCHDDRVVFHVGGALLGYILDQMEPTSCNRCDYLETCTYCQMVFGKQFPPRHYCYSSVRASTWY